MDWIQETVAQISEDKYLQAALILGIALIAAVIVDLFINHIIARLTRRTRSDIDDRIIGLLRKPVFMTVFLSGINYSLKKILAAPAVGPYLHTRIILTLITLIWLGVALRMSTLFLSRMASNQARFQIIQPVTLPIFDISAKIVFMAIAAYAVIQAWQWDATAWAASAGVIGITVGLAARDTVANLFAGIFILADTPYKVGDYVVLDNGERGRVTKIGLRSTRILTRDDVEITIPNSNIANSRIVNESGGPWVKYRTRIPVGVAYGSDIDAVRNCLLEVAAANADVCREPEPRVRMRAFGDSSLDFELLCWIEEPEFRGRVNDELLTATYKEFRLRGIEIPYPKRDVYMHPVKGEEPGGPGKA